MKTLSGYRNKVVSSMQHHYCLSRTKQAFVLSNVSSSLPYFTNNFKIKFQIHLKKKFNITYFIIWREEMVHGVDKNADVWLDSR